MSASLNLIPVEKRILLHLLPYNTQKYDYEIPYELTQKGIAVTVGACIAWVSIPIRKYVNEGIIYECKGRVNPNNRKQKYYFLTDEGKKYTQKIKSDLLKIQITIEESGNRITTKPLGEIANYFNGQKIYPNITESDIYSSISKDCIIDINCLHLDEKKKFIDFSSDAPKIQIFYGRKKELSILENWIDDKKESSFFYIYGMVGIGKTTLAVKFIGLVAKPHNY
jgi:DNA-binding MarR family transcriptional regulator